jgi:uncharacterized protein (DUF1330 family)
MAQVPNLDPALAAINPSSAQAAAFLALDPARPVIFVNLHEYHERARYPPDYAGADGPAQVSGREAYHRYLSALEQQGHAKVGGRMVIVAPCELVMVGSGPWHEVVITYYPTRAAAMQLAAFPEYAATLVHRIAGLKSVTTLELGERALDYLPAFK